MRTKAILDKDVRTVRAKLESLLISLKEMKSATFENDSSMLYDISMKIMSRLMNFATANLLSITSKCQMRQRHNTP